MPPSKPSESAAQIAHWKAWADRAVHRDKAAELTRKADWVDGLPSDHPDLKHLGFDQRQALSARLRNAAAHVGD